MQLIQVHCDNCGNDGGDADLVLIEKVVGKILIGMKPDGSFVGDGEPLHFERQSTHGPQVWCDACGCTTIPITNEE